ncbi:MAG: flagellar basal body rod protein FlgG [Chloroflexota bacterium]
MIKGLYTAASGMLLGMRQQEVVADNLANSNTVGYKADQSAQTAFSGVLARRVGASETPMPASVETLIGRVGTGAFVENVRTFLGQGSERETGGPLDVMVRGDGFFVVQSPDGVRYTRDGHWDRDDQQRLITADGSLVLDDEGAPVIIESDHIRVKPDGRIMLMVATPVEAADGSTVNEVREQLVARLQVVNLNADDLIRAGASQFLVAPGATVTPVDFTQGATFVLQGSLEEANVNVGQNATQLYSVARSYSSSQRVFSAINDTLALAVRDIGRV